MRKIVSFIAICISMTLAKINASDVEKGSDLFPDNTKPKQPPIASSSENALDVSVRTKSEQTQTVPANYDLKADYEASKQPDAPAPATPATPTAPTPAPEPVAESGSGCGCDTQKWAAEPFFGGYRSIHHNEDIFAGGVALEYTLISKLQLKGEFVGLSINEHHAQDSAGGGFNFIVRYSPFRTWNGRLAMFVEGGAGVNEFTHRTPAPNGTHFNFSPQGGIGGSLKISDRLSFILSGRYLHISNANKDGEKHNPGIDTAGGYAGLQIRF